MRELRKKIISSDKSLTGKIIKRTTLIIIGLFILLGSFVIFMGKKTTFRGYNTMLYGTIEDGVTIEKERIREIRLIVKRVSQIVNFNASSPEDEGKEDGRYSNIYLPKSASLKEKHLGEMLEDVIKENDNIEGIGMFFEPGIFNKEINSYGLYAEDGKVDFVSDYKDTNWYQETLRGKGLFRVRDFSKGDNNNNLVY